MRITDPSSARAYRIKEVDSDDEDIKGTLGALHTLTFGTGDPVPEFYGNWWIVYYKGDPVAFAGIVPSTIGDGVGYLKRSGVLPDHRGRGLQRRLLRVRERHAVSNGWHRVVTDTTDNVPSANNMIRAGYRLFDPKPRWAFEHSLYWTKNLKGTA